MPESITRTVLLFVTLCLTWATSTSAQEPITVVPSWADKEQDKALAKLKSGLEKQINIAFKDTPLTEVAAYIQEESGVSFRINRRGLRNEGLLDDVPITISLKQVRLKTALNLMLDQLYLTWVNSDNRIMITSSQDSENREEVRHHFVLDLAMEEDHQEPDYDAIKELMTITIEPESWWEGTGPILVYIIDGGIVFDQTDSIHEKVAALFDTLRAVKKLPNNKYDVTPLDIMGTDSTDHSIQEKLAKPIEEVNFKEAPLHEVMDFLSESIDLNIYISERSLDDIGKTPSLKVSGQWKNTPAKTILHDLLSEHDLAYKMYDDVVLITTLEEVERDLSTKIYPVRDFIGHDTTDYELLRWNSEYYGESDDYDELIYAISAKIEPNSWERFGGPVAISLFELAECLVISQTDEVHQEIEKVLTRIRQKRKGQPIDKPWLVNADKPLVHAYTLPGLFAQRNSPTEGELQKSLERLIALITNKVEPESWEKDSNTIEAIGDRLIVTQVRANHLKIYEFLSDLGFLYSSQRPIRGFGGGFQGNGMGFGPEKGGGFGGGGQHQNEWKQLEKKPETEDTSTPPMQGGFF